MAFTGPYPTVFSGNATAMVISHTAFSGGVINVGTIGPRGIVVIDSTFQSGGLTNTGTILGGIHIDGSSKLVASGGTAVAVENTATFTGGISNAGALSGRRGILVGATTSTNPHVGIFSGGVINNGAISTLKTDIAVRFVSVFAGGITNRGALTAASAAAILVSNIATAAGATFAGNIVNSGAISAAGIGLDIANVAGNNGTFDGRIVNTGKISAGQGIGISNVGATLFSGGISNSGSITATAAAGVFVNNVADAIGATFAGNIVNGGAIGASALGLGIQAVAGAGGRFDGSIINTAAISALDTGIKIADAGASLFSGNISNSGAITEKTTGVAGILVSSVANAGGATFAGNIVNGGAISAANGFGLTFASNQIHLSYGSATGSGILFVSSGATLVAQVNMIGSYTSANFSARADGSGSVEIFDPMVVNGGSVQPLAASTFPRSGIDLPDIAFGAQTTLAYAANATGTGGTLTVSDGRHTAAIALLGNYMAGSFVAVADGHGGSLITEGQSGQPLLTRPPHG